MGEKITKEKLESIIRQFEGVLKTSTDDKQRKRVSIELKKRYDQFKYLYPESEDLSKIEESHIEDLTDEQRKLSKIDKFEILKSLPSKQMHPLCEDREINELFTFINFFEEEYWGVLSDYHLKLDFNHSLLRDSFYTELQSAYNVLKNYSDMIVQINNPATNKTYKETLKQSKLKEYRNMLLKVGEFINKLHTFISDLLRNYKDGGNIIMNPQNIMHFDSLLGKKKLEGKTVIDGLENLKSFLDEFLLYLNVPVMKK